MMKERRKKRRDEKEEEGWGRERKKRSVLNYLIFPLRATENARKIH